MSQSTTHYLILPVILMSTLCTACIEDAPPNRKIPNWCVLLHEDKFLAYPAEDEATTGQQRSECEHLLPCNAQWQNISK